MLHNFSFGSEPSEENNPRHRVEHVAFDFAFSEDTHNPPLTFYTKLLA